jgi:predicted Zn finger-like uncharacterized protein
MRINCPHCAAIYEVPEERLTGRKAVRCARCLAEFDPTLPGSALHEPVPPEPVSPEPVPPEPSAAIDESLPERHDQPPEPRPTLSSAPADGTVAISAMQRLVQSAPPQRSSGSLIGWVLSLLVLACILWGVFNWRTEIMKAWPPSARAYEALGLTDTTK